MIRVVGAGRGAPLVLMTVALSLWSASAAPVSLARQEEAPAPVVVGAGPVREPALALVGRTVYEDDSATMFGYLTATIGLDPALLFTASPPAAETARLTYVAEIALAPTANRGDVSTFDGEGVLRIYVDEEAGAAWDDPDSFAAGEPVAEFTMTLRDTLQRQGPGVGVVVGDERLEQVTAGEFTLAGEPYRFGQTGIEARLRTVGALASGDAESAGPAVTVALTGAVSVTARDSIPVVMGDPTG